MNTVWIYVDEKFIELERDDRRLIWDHVHHTEKDTKVGYKERKNSKYSEVTYHAPTLEECVRLVNKRTQLEIDELESDLRSLRARLVVSTPENTVPRKSK